MRTSGGVRKTGIISSADVPYIQPLTHWFKALPRIQKGLQFCDCIKACALAIVSFAIHGHEPDLTIPCARLTKIIVA